MNNGIDAVFFLKTVESLDIKIDSFNKSLKPLFCQQRIVKSLKLLSWLCSKRKSETDNSLKLVIKNLPKFRPILSVINTPEYNIAKFLIPILERLTHNDFTTKDSFSFAKEITTCDSSLYMASLDVESLFINILLKEIINNCVSDLSDKNLYNGKLSSRDIFKLLETAVSESSFLFDYLLYKQVDGEAMGSPLVPTLANDILKYT